MSPGDLARLERVVANHRARVSHIPRVLMVLGSGLGSVADAVEKPVAVPFEEMDLPVSGVQGHHGVWISGFIGTKPVVVMQGRVHLYEGHSPHDVVLGVRAAIRLGVKTVVLTNAAGGIHSSFNPGDLMMIADHLNLTGTSSLIGPNATHLGPRFADMSEVYARPLRQRLSAVGASQNIALKQGVYAGLLGPAYETPAEIRMLRTLGADAVGMSTVLEAIAARHMGAAVIGISCITNLAAGIASEDMRHDDVLRAASQAQIRLSTLLVNAIESMSDV